MSNYNVQICMLTANNNNEYFPLDSLLVDLPYFGNFLQNCALKGGYKKNKLIK